MGRPALPDNEKHDHPFRIYLDAVDSRLVIALAKKRGQAPAALLRELIRSKLEAATATFSTGTRVSESLRD